MLKSNREIMSLARQSLNGKWGITVVGTLIYFILLFGLNSLSYFGYILHSVLLVGYAAFMLVIIRKQDIKLEILFSGLSRFFPAILAGLFIGVIMFLLCLPTVIGTVLIVGAHLPIYISIVPIVIICFTIVFAAIFVLKVYYSYTLVYFLISDLPKTSAFKALKLSRDIMHGNQLKRLYLDCRFLGWFLLGVFPNVLISTISEIHQHGFSASLSDCFTYWNKSEANPWSSDFALICDLVLVGFLWIMPYWRASASHFYEDVKRDYEDNLSSSLSIITEEITDFFPVHPK